MGYNVSFVGGDIFVGGSKVECFVKEILANGRIEFFDIKANEVRVLFSLSGVKPVDYRCSVFPSTGLTPLREKSTLTSFALISKNSIRPSAKISLTPPITTKNIPAGINKRLSSLSSDKASFDQAAPPY